MSSIEILKNFYDYGTSGIANIDDLSTIPLTFTKWSKEKLIYCNQPEQIREGNYGEDGKFLNRATIEPNKKNMLYASYDHRFSGSIGQDMREIFSRAVWIETAKKEKQT